MSEDRQPEAAPRESQIELDPRPPVDRIRKAGLLLAILGGLILLAVVTYLSPAPSVPQQEEAEGVEESPLASQYLERWTRPAPAADARELEAALEAPAERRSRFSRGTVSPVAPAPLAVDLPGPSRARGREASVSDEAARLGLTAPWRLRAEASGALEALSGVPSGASSDPRQLPRPRANAVRVELEEPLTPFQIRQGTAIPAVLTQAVGSGLGGPVRALVTTDIYDAATHGHVLIPRGTLALGVQPRQPLLGERRLLLVWTRLLLPDGRSFRLDDVPAAGGDGALGVPGQVHGHWRQRFGAAALLSLVGAGVQLSQPQRSGRDGSAPDAGQVAAGALGLELGRLSQEVLRRSVDLPPEISLEPGTPLYLVVTQDLAFDRPYRDPSHQRASTPLVDISRAVEIPTGSRGHPPLPADREGGSGAWPGVRAPRAVNVP